MKNYWFDQLFLLKAWLANDNSIFSCESAGSSDTTLRIMMPNYVFPVLENEWHYINDNITHKINVITNARTVINYKITNNKNQNINIIL